MTALADFLRAAFRPAGVPLRYVDHWPTRGPCERRIESDPNPMPRFRLWRRGGRR